MPGYDAIEEAARTAWADILSKVDLTADHDTRASVIRDALWALADVVTSQRSFLVFIEVLALDKNDEDERERHQPTSPFSKGWNGWEHGTIRAYLDAVAASQAHAGAEEASWRGFARMLLAGKYYE